MINRIDLPSDSAFFSNDTDGKKPYVSKFTTPISRIYYADTPFTVRSLGLTATWVNKAEKGINTWRDTAYSGTIPGGIVKFWWDYGYPQEITNPSDKNYWGLKLSGYFKPEYNGNYKFYFGGAGEIQDLNINGVSRASGLKMNLGDQAYRESSSILLSSASWVTFTLMYRTTISQNLSAGLVCLYRMIDNSTTMPEKVVLSAGVTAPSGTAPSGSNMPIPFHTVTGYNDVVVTSDEFGVQQLRFSVPFIANDGYVFRGYTKYGTNSYHNIEDTSYSYFLKPFRMITYYEGYVNSASSQEMVQKFMGHIKDIEIAYSSDGDDKLNITCYSPINFTRTQFVEHNPNPSDYIAAGYLTDVVGHVDGVDKPRAYDGWELYKVFQNLLLNSYIDPTLFYKKKIFSGYSSQRLEGDYLIAYTGKTEKLWLSRQRNYGSPGNINSVNVQPDDEYSYAADAGEFYYDLINKFTDQYLFRWGFDRRGQPFLKAIDTPYRIINDDDFTYPVGSWTEKLDDFDCIEATYKQSQTLNALATTTGYFSRADLVLRVGTNTGGNVSVSIRLASNPVLVMASTVLAPYNNKTWSYYDGADPSTGLNPSIFNIASGLKYDRYVVTIQKSTSAGYINLDGLLLYDEDVNYPSFNFKTSDQVSPGHVVELDISESAGEIRNTCIVLGKRTGTKTGYVDDFVTSDLNPNNPINTFYSSKAIDLNSISSPSAVNYSGVPLKTVIVEPSITSQEQADFIAFEFVKENRAGYKEVEFATLGNPLLEVNDCITVSDDIKSGITNTKKLWITSIENGMSDTYITKFSAIDIKPPSSYYQKPQPDLSKFGNNPIQNVKIYNAGVNSKTTQAILAVSTFSALTVNASLQYAPPKGYIKVISSGNYSIMKYEYISSSAGVWQYNTLRQGLQGTSVRAFSSNATVIGAWDPYTQDGLNIVPVITFDLLADSEIEVLVKGNISTGIGINIARLTNQYSNSYPYDGYNQLTWGTNKYFTWNGMDDFGYWNTNYVRDLPVENKSGIFAGEPFSVLGVQQEYGTFYPEITARFNGQTKTVPSLSSVNSVQKIYTRRGSLSSLRFTILYNSFYVLTGNQTETYYTSTTTYGNNYMNKYLPYMKSGANNNEFLQFLIKDISTDYGVDSDYYRQHRIYLDAKLENYCGYYFDVFLSDGIFGPHKAVFKDVAEFKTKRTILDGKDFRYDLYNLGNGLSGSFNPEITVDDIEFRALPPDDFLNKTKKFISTMQANPNFSSISGGIYFIPVIIFNGYIFDKSGRTITVTNLPKNTEDIINSYSESIGNPAQLMGWAYLPVIGTKKPYSSGTVLFPNSIDGTHTPRINDLIHDMMQAWGFDTFTAYRIVMYYLGIGEF